MKPERHSLDDLLILARRSELSLEDDRRLRKALEGDPELRVIFGAGRAFDAEAPVVAGDDERIAVIGRRVESRLRMFRGPTAPRWRRMVGFALAAVIVAAAAVGTIKVVRTLTPDRSSDPPMPTMKSTTTPIPT
jgi:hypothetical protein